MKNIFKILMVVGLLSFTACADESGLNNWFDKPAEGGGLELTLSQDAIVIDESTQWGDYSISWTDAIPPTDEYSISGYKIMVTPVDQPTATPLKVEVSAHANSYKWVLRDVYLFIFNNWNYLYGEAMDLKVEVLAEVSGGQFYYKPIRAEQIWTVTPMEIPVRSFYIVGEANPRGANPEFGIEIGCVEQGYSDQLNQNKDVVLNPNSKFVLSLSRDSKFPAFMRKKKLSGQLVDGWEAVLVETEADAANYEEFETLNPYQEQSLGTKNNYAVSMEYDQITRGANVYIGRRCTSDAYAVGDAINRSWGPWVKFQWNYQYPDVVYLAQEFYDAATTGSEGAFKVSDRDGNWGDNGRSWRPASGGANPFDDNRVVTQYGGDPKWKMPAGISGMYIMALNNADLTITMIPME